MLRHLVRAGNNVNGITSPWSRLLSTSAASRHTERLRILFCGSDEFSCESLRAVNAEHNQNKELIESLEVMVLPPKRVGRGYKTIREGKYLLR